MSDIHESERHVRVREPISPAIIVVGIIAGLWGLLQLCGSAMGAFAPIMMRSMMEGSSQLANEPSIAIYKDDTIFWWTIVGTLGNLPLAFVLLATSLGLIMRQRWARTSGYVYCVGEAALIVLSLAMNLVLVMPAMEEAAAGASASKQAEMRFGMYLGMGSGLCCPAIVVAGLGAFLSTALVRSQLGLDERPDASEVFE